MASSPHPRARGQIKRVPVPARDPAPGPASISTTILSSPAVIQPTPSSTPPSTQAPLAVRGQHRPRGPIPLVSTNSHQPIPTHFSHRHEYNHHSQIPTQYSLHTIGMDPESQNRHYMLPPQMEEDIKAAVLASISSTDYPMRMQKRKTVVHRKNIRWTSLSICIALIIGEIPVSVLYGVQPSSIFAYTLGTLLALWNGWRLFRMRQKFGNERISGWHIGLEVVSLSALIATTVVVPIWAMSQANNQVGGSWRSVQYFWHGLAIAFLLFICLILHFVLLIMTAVEKWTKPAYLQLAVPTDAQYQQPPPIIVQYCPNCHSHEPRLGEDENSYLASIGDSQPQGVAPVNLTKQNEAMEKDSLKEHEFYGLTGGVRT
ncbi:hypothetical protein ANO14919_017710 [Xylariales sp. No.14919]|nr:hypothetical protein ANO14919_017710 [Xylariales sp. No.14919]